MDHSSLVDEYYRCLDAHEYNTLQSVLHPEFVQHRPDRSFESRQAFIEFMRTGRPDTDTTHEVDTVLASTASLAAYGRLLDADGTELIEFIDVFRFDDDRILAVETFS